MRRICTMAALLAMVASGAPAAVAAAPQSDRQIAELSGPVKSVRLEVLKFDNYTGKLDTDRMPGPEEWYDRAGSPVEQKYHTPDFIEDRHPQRIDGRPVHRDSRDVIPDFHPNIGSVHGKSLCNRDACAQYR